jgi:hypothetical protein
MNKLDFTALAQRLLISADTLVPQWLAGGRRRGHEWVCGDLAGGEGDSCSVNLLSGRWADFATNERGGDLIGLYAAIHEISMGDAYRELSDEAPASDVPPKPRLVKTQRKVIVPVPSESADCDCVHNSYGPPSQRWAYYDGNGDVLGYVARYDPPGQRKQIIPWTFSPDGWGMGQWPVPRPLYRLQELEARHADAVLIVEGEKAADSAAALDGSPYVAVTWPGGAQALGRADWKVLQGRRVLLWPDADEAGIAAMQRLAEILAPIASEIKIIDVTGQPEGWDCADSGWTRWSEARAWIAPRARTVGAPAPAPPAPEVQAAEKAVAARDISSLEPSEWYARFAYCTPDDSFFDLLERTEITRSAFNAVYRHVRCHSIHASSSGGARRIEASTSYDENRTAMGARVLSGVTYAPGTAPLVEHQGQIYGNKWRDGRPQIEDAIDPQPWLDHIERLIPDPVERNHMLDAFAYKVQHPGVKINHAILIGGIQGAGKDSMIAPLLYAIGGKNKLNCASVETAELQQQWGYYLENEVVIFNELRQSEAVDRRALENRLKPILAAPPELLTVQRKMMHPIQVRNQALVLAMSNFRDAIAIPSEDRRWFVVWTHAPKMSDQESAALWDWFNGGGLQAGALYLRRRDVTKFQPGATPPWTEAKSIMVNTGRSAAESWIVERIEKRMDEFRLGVLSGPWQAVVDRLQNQAPEHIRVTNQALQHALAEAGWTDLGLCASRTNPGKRHIWASPEFRGSKSEARDATETHIAAMPSTRPYRVS